MRHARPIGNPAHKRGHAGQMSIKTPAELFCRVSKERGGEAWALQRFGFPAFTRVILSVHAETADGALHHDIQGGSIAVAI